MKDLKTILFRKYHNAEILHEHACYDFSEEVRLTGEDPDKLNDREVFRQGIKRQTLWSLISEAGLIAEYDDWDFRQKDGVILRGEETR